MVKKWPVFGMRPQVNLCCGVRRGRAPSPPLTGLPFAVNTNSRLTALMANSVFATNGHACGLAVTWTHYGTYILHLWLRYMCAVTVLGSSYRSTF